ncbi:MAG: hypothetical protein MJH09_01225 [Cetobacterium sp.]|nr:hypothetical protein [Cetobacterium sp.]
MKYFLFLNHPKGEKIYKLSEKREYILREYFKSVNTIDMSLKIEGKVYDCVVDYTVFSNLANFDCFNCQDPCYADNPSIYSNETRNLILNNLELYNMLTKNIEILNENEYSFEEIINHIKTSPLMVPEETVEEEISLCTCSFKPNNKSTLCSIHSICLKNNMSAEEIISSKPLVCNLWPLDIIAEDDLSKLYITLPDDFTTGFTIEDYYDTPCINKELAKSSTFRRKNPEGFHEKDYVPILIAYKETLIHIFGEEFYEKIKENLLKENLLYPEDFQEYKEQIFRNI